MNWNKLLATRNVAKIGHDYLSVSVEFDDFHNDGINIRLYKDKAQVAMFNHKQASAVPLQSGVLMILMGSLQYVIEEE